MINSEEVDILGIKIDRRLFFHQHIKSISKKAGQKLSALLRIIYNKMIKCQFNYSPLVWLFCSRKSNNLIDKVQERALRLTYKDNENNSQTLATKWKQWNICTPKKPAVFLMMEIYNIKNNYAPPTFNP